MQIFYNANIYAAKQPNATAFAINHGHFAALGSDTDILNGFSHAVLKVDLQNRTIWPGLTDSHLHLRHLADCANMVDCETETLKECLARVKKAADQTQNGSWIRGHGWNQNHWESGFGNAHMLDTVCNGRPAFLTAKSLHAAWVNSQALKLADINLKTTDPPGGIIQRDESDQPTGILFENGAIDLVKSIIPKPTRSEVVSKLKSLFTKLWELGLVGVHDFDGIDCWDALQECYQNNTLHLRVRKSIPYKHLESFIQAGLRTNFGDDRLNIGCVKLFADGALGPQTAAMKSPYEGTDNYGTLLLPEGEIVEIGKYATRNGIALAVHAIGDHANHIVLNAFEKLRKFEQAHHLPHFHHRIEHVQVIDPKDLPRLSKLDITASVQPIHAPSDMEITERHLGNRAKNAYAFRTMIENDICCIFGSDAPVESVNPFHGIHAAVTRRRMDGSPGLDGWHPEQRLSLSEALEGFTFLPAKLINKGGHLGRIAEGYKADFLILEENPMTIDPHRLSEIEPAATFIDGECVFQSSSLPMNLKYL
ncbi:MAG: amidohydrolase [Chloroflexota bacterium]|nr:amidohydrolase [Chloroflexota bacterium]